MPEPKDDNATYTEFEGAGVGEWVGPAVGHLAVTGSELTSTQLPVERL